MRFVSGLASLLHPARASASDKIGSQINFRLPHPANGPKAVGAALLASGAATAVTARKAGGT